MPLLVRGAKGDRLCGIGRPCAAPARPTPWSSSGFPDRSTAGGRMPGRKGPPQVTAAQRSASNRGAGRSLALRPPVGLERPEKRPERAPPAPRKSRPHSARLSAQRGGQVVTSAVRSVVKPVVASAVNSAVKSAVKSVVKIKRGAPRGARVRVGRLRPDGGLRDRAGGQIVVKYWPNKLVERRSESG